MYLDYDTNKDSDLDIFSCVDGHVIYVCSGDRYIHVATVPPGVKGLSQAVAWYERRVEQREWEEIHPAA